MAINPREKFSNTVLTNLSSMLEQQFNVWTVQSQDLPGLSQNVTVTGDVDCTKLPRAKASQCALCQSYLANLP